MDKNDENDEDFEFCWREEIINGYLYLKIGKRLHDYIPSLGNNLYHAFGKGKHVYITKLVYERREITPINGSYPD